jgi:hypothetical protein
MAIVALIPNIAASAALTLVCRKSGLQDGYDETQPVSCTANHDASGHLSWNQAPAVR